MSAHEQVNEVLDVLPIEADLIKGRCSLLRDTTVWRLSLYSPLAALHET